MSGNANAAVGLQTGLCRLSACIRRQHLGSIRLDLRIMAGVRHGGGAVADQARQAAGFGTIGVVIGSKTVQKANDGRARLEDCLNEMRAVLNGG